MDNISFFGLNLIACYCFNILTLKDAGLQTCCTFEKLSTYVNHYPRNPAVQSCIRLCGLQRSALVIE